MPVSRFPSSRPPLSGLAAGRSGERRARALPGAPGKFLSAGNRAASRKLQTRPGGSGCGHPRIPGVGGLRSRACPPPTAAWRTSTSPSGSRPLPAATQRASSAPRQRRTWGSGARAAISPRMRAGPLRKRRGWPGGVCAPQGSGPRGTKCSSRSPARRSGSAFRGPGRDAGGRGSLTGGELRGAPGAILSPERPARGGRAHPAPGPRHPLRSRKTTGAGLPPTAHPGGSPTSSTLTGRRALCKGRAPGSRSRLCPAGRGRSAEAGPSPSPRRPGRPPASRGPRGRAGPCSRPGRHPGVRGQRPPGGRSARTPGGASPAGGGRSGCRAPVPGASPPSGSRTPWFPLLPAGAGPPSLPLPPGAARRRV